MINGKYANILGRVCMDQFMIDITDIPNVKRNTVTLIGRDGDEYLFYGRSQRTGIFV